MPILPSQRSRFDIPDDVTYLNCAYMGPLLREVTAAAQAGVARKARPWEIKAADFFSLTRSARQSFSRLLGPPARPEDVAIIPAASYGMAVACNAIPLRAGQRVILLNEEFPSTIVSWRAAAGRAGATAHLIDRPDGHDWTAAILAAIDDRTAVAALPHCHWIDGALLDLPRIRARLNDVGAALVLDLTQSLGVLPFDLAAIDPDFLVAACYKWLLGPYTVGFLYAAPRWHSAAPIEHSWFTRKGSEDFSALADYQSELQPGALRFDMGEPANFGLLPGAIAALDQIVAWGVPNIYESAARIADLVVERAAPLGLTAVPAPLRARHYLGLRSARPLPPDLLDRLARDRIYVSVRGAQTIRVTPHVYNEEQDVDRFFAGLTRALT